VRETGVREGVEGELVREGAADAWAAARGDHLQDLFVEVMADGRRRRDWHVAMRELYVAVNMSDPKRVFMSNRRFDLYGRPKDSLFTPFVFEEPVLASEEPEADVKAQLAFSHLLHLARKGENHDSGDDTAPSEAGSAGGARDNDGMDGSEAAALEFRPATTLDARPASNLRDAHTGVPAAAAAASPRGREIAAGGCELWPMDMETIETRVAAGAYQVLGVGVGGVGCRV